MYRRGDRLVAVIKHYLNDVGRRAHQEANKGVYGFIDSAFERLADLRNGQYALQIGDIISFFQRFFYFGSGEVDTGLYGHQLVNALSSFHDRPLTHIADGLALLLYGRILPSHRTSYTTLFRIARNLHSLENDDGNEDAQACFYVFFSRMTQTASLYFEAILIEMFKNQLNNINQGTFASLQLEIPEDIRNFLLATETKEFLATFLAEKALRERANIHCFGRAKFRPFNRQHHQNEQNQPHRIVQNNIRICSDAGDDRIASTFQLRVNTVPDADIQLDDSDRHYLVNNALFGAFLQEPVERYMTNEHLPDISGITLDQLTIRAGTLAERNELPQLLADFQEFTCRREALQPDDAMLHLAMETARDFFTKQVARRFLFMYRLP